MMQVRPSRDSGTREVIAASEHSGNSRKHTYCSKWRSSLCFLFLTITPSFHPLWLPASMNGPLIMSHHPVSPVMYTIHFGRYSIVSGSHNSRIHIEVLSLAHVLTLPAAFNRCPCAITRLNHEVGHDENSGYYKVDSARGEEMPHFSSRLLG